MALIAWSNFPMKILLLWATSATLAAVGLWLVASALTGDALTPVRLLNYATPWIGMGLSGASLVLYFFGYKRWSSVYLLTALIVLSSYYSQLGRIATDVLWGQDDPSYTMRVISYNLMTRNTDMTAAARVLKQNSADLIFLQEVGMPREFTAAISGLYGVAPMFIARSDDSNLMIISRFPLRDKPTVGNIQEAVLVSPIGEINLRNLHFVKAINSDELQQREMRNLVQEISSVTDPVIVAGDINQTQNSEGYQMLREWLVNTHEESGVGFGFTFPTSMRRIGKVMPFIRIDHLFVSRHFSVHTSGVIGESGGSDHYPITADISLR